MKPKQILTQYTNTQSNNTNENKQKEEITQIRRADKKIDTLTQIYSTGEVEATLSPNPDDRSIMELIVQNKAYANPILTMEDCHDPKTALKMFMASKIVGVKLKLGSNDEAAIIADPKLNERYNEIKNIAKNLNLQEAVMQP